MGRSFRMRVAPIGGDETNSVEMALKTLQQSVRDAKDLAEPWSQFFDRVAPLVSEGDRVQFEPNPHIESVLTIIGSRVLGKKSTITQPMFLHLPAYDFWHGTCLYAAKLMAFFYFEDIDKGMATIVSQLDLSDPRTQFIRFSMVDAPPKTVPSKNRGSA